MLRKNDDQNVHKIIICMACSFNTGSIMRVNEKRSTCITKLIYIIKYNIAAIWPLLKINNSRFTNLKIHRSNIDQNRIQCIELAVAAYFLPNSCGYKQINILLILLKIRHNIMHSEQTFRVHKYVITITVEPQLSVFAINCALSSEIPYASKSYTHITVFKLHHSKTKKLTTTDFNFSSVSFVIFPSFAIVSNNDFSELLHKFFFKSSYFGWDYFIKESSYTTSDEHRGSKVVEWMHPNQNQIGQMLLFRVSKKICPSVIEMTLVGMYADTSPA
ncbi:hypothetical protein AGLY_005291 [Aphis glycines]|uniref:Uncharacterized protein n=1 Tax=Aphis glycines TaxID=307491 RepID=A0A6G0TYL7_APHGL|nr:hypothetical protein AGLY_005291 [Aphis glycines]